MNPAAREALLEHYDRERRDLPWRDETEPYRILVSEVMLQQTRVDTVLGYYEPWLERFPDVESLAVAEEDRVLEAWAGLGYYRRARNLHRAARYVREELAGRVPSDFEALKSLPGVGEYTAGAVASIAFGEAVPAVDGNVRRVFSRFYDEADPKPAWLRRRAAEIVDPTRPGDWNQALMELGATVCTPRSPSCGSCPVAEWCAALAAGSVAERPAPVKKGRVVDRTYAVGVFESDGRFLLVRRPSGGLLGGMWAFPEREVGEGGSASVMGEEATVPAQDVRAEEVQADEARAQELRVMDVPAGDVRAAADEIARDLGLEWRGDPAPMSPVQHRFSHIAATYLPVRGRVAELAGEAAGATAAAETAARSSQEGRRWVRPEESEGMALPKAQRTIMRAVAGVK